MKNYRLYYEPIEDRWHYEHRRFACDVLDEKYLVHHKDCNPKNNNPNNLIWCSKSKHQQIHADLSTGCHSEFARSKKSASITEWHKNNKNTEIYKIRSKKLHDAALKQHNRTEQDYINRQLDIQAQHERGKKQKELYEENKQKKLDYISDIEKTFNIKWDNLTINEKDSYSVRYQRLTHPETVEKISNAISNNHKQGKYKNAIVALARCNEDSKRLKELCPDIDKQLFFDIFGFSYDSIDGHKRAPWATKYRKIVCKEITNHKVISVKKLDYTEDVYDLTVQDNHNFALSAGIFVHNSKDLSDAICGSLWNASRHADEFAFEFGEDIDTLVQVSSSKSQNKQQIIVDMEEELNKLFDPLQDKKDPAFIDFGLGSATENYAARYLMNGIIV